MARRQTTVSSRSTRATPSSSAATSMRSRLIRQSRVQDCLDDHLRVRLVLQPQREALQVLQPPLVANVPQVHEHDPAGTWHWSCTVRLRTRRGARSPRLATAARPMTRRTVGGGASAVRGVAALRRGRRLPLSELCGCDTCRTRMWRDTQQRQRALAESGLRVQRSRPCGQPKERDDRLGIWRHPGDPKRAFAWSHVRGAYTQRWSARRIGRPAAGDRSHASVSSCAAERKIWPVSRLMCAGQLHQIQWRRRLCAVGNLFQRRLPDGLLCGERTREKAVGVRHRQRERRSVRDKPLGAVGFAFTVNFRCLAH